jgi:two-component system NtrC family sensor kinase
MLLSRGSRRPSIKAELIWSYLIILGAAGLATSFLGSWIVSSTIMTQARRAVDRDFAATNTVYDQRLEALRLPVEFAAPGLTIKHYFADHQDVPLFAYLDRIRKEAGFDFLNLTDVAGRVLARVSRPDRTQDDVSSISVVRAALSGKLAAGTEVLSDAVLDNEDPALLSRARFRIGAAEKTLGMALVAAAPVGDGKGGVIGALYGGVLLSRDSRIVDRIGNLLKAGDFEAGAAGRATIFQNDVRIATNVRTAAGERALGTLAPKEVSDAVLRRGETWYGRALVVNDWYMSEYAPVRNYDGRVIGMLAAGLPENTYTGPRNRVIFSFFCLAGVGFVLIIGITYVMIGNITRPLGEMVAATRKIRVGDFDQEVRLSSPDEIAQLADAFNAMLKSLRQGKSALEEWGRTLEEKVKQRTEELSAMQVRVAQAERLASLGMLAAGVAHEVNNPLGAILTLTALTLEDMKEDDPNRGNLEEVVRQSARCRDIVKGLLAFSRQSKAEKELVDVNKILEETLALIDKQAQFFNVNIIRNCDPDLPAVMADQSQVQQVFMNILVNAAQAMDERGTITVVTRYEASASCIEVAISDTGRGIPPEQIDRIFDPFFTSKTSGEGTGLGLSIAYGIVTTHGGTISVKSEIGKGSTFTIRLPLIPARQEARA